MDRRKFLKTAVAAGAATAARMSESVFAAADQESSMTRRHQRLGVRPLGKTGRKLSIIGFGGIVVSGVSQSHANRVVAEAIDRGVNYFDVSPTYGNAEQRLGPALEGRRKNIFLACKTLERGKAGAAQELDQSLNRLRTDHVDVYQLHGLRKMGELEQALGPRGAMETFVAARQAGKIGLIGFSAHSAEVALAAMDQFDFDTILFPFNFVCWYEANFGPQVLEKARKKQVGCLALKAMALTTRKKGDPRKRFPKCWYQPIDDPQLASLGLRFTLSQPVTAAIPPGDEGLFRLALDIAEGFTPITRTENNRLEDRAKGLKPIFELQAGG